MLNFVGNLLLFLEPIAYRQLNSIVVKIDNNQSKYGYETMRHFAVIPSAVWQTRAMRSLSNDGCLLALFVLTCRYETEPGVINLPDEHITRVLNWGSDRILAAFEELKKLSIAERDDKTGIVKMLGGLSPTIKTNPYKKPPKVLLKDKRTHKRGLL